ncbi:helix-turn-helix transcriptional regulator [Providencia rettgeri]|uniref:helix-turn-helix domain-containing protein n=1 Tax=Providencia rettgeri TaxID=587 RepID=UPI001B393BFB|nr:helix-turn-helix transcriptional regulator [Providencia rettgeri]MBQ0342056.1 helix-turn-helix transcriptional regulator [Providencia rettgeri]MCJ2225445.1 helix-turn-helix domain-containing protein [Providencia rettgeri]
MKSNKLKTSIDSFQKILTEQIGMELSHLRKEKGLSGSDLAKKLKISQQQISRYETGKTSLTIDQLSHLLRLLDKNWVELILFVQSECDIDIKLEKEKSKKSYLLSNYLIDSFINKKQ